MSNKEQKNNTYRQIVTMGKEGENNVVVNLSVTTDDIDQFVYRTPLTEFFHVLDSGISVASKGLLGHIIDKRIEVLGASAVNHAVSQEVAECAAYAFAKELYPVEAVPDGVDMSALLHLVAITFFVGAAAYAAKLIKSREADYFDGGLGVFDVFVGEYAEKFGIYSAIGLDHQKRLAEQQIESLRQMFVTANAATSLNS